MIMDLRLEEVLLNGDGAAPIVAVKSVELVRCSCASFFALLKPVVASSLFCLSYGSVPVSSGDRFYAVDLY